MRKQSTPGTSYLPFDPEEGDTCEWELQQKIGNRWTHAACGSKAEVIVAFYRGGDTERRVKLCRSCLGRLIRELVRTLE